MRITYYANAMILLESKFSRILCDPWVTFNRNSISGLYNFPELIMTKEQVKEINPDFIYISHTHADHFDPITLGIFPLNTPILVAKYVHNFTERNIRRLGFTDVRVIDNEVGQALNGDDWCWIEPNEIYPEVDSLLVSRLDGEIAVNLNDNPFSKEQCERLVAKYHRIKLACVPYCFQGPYPAFYENLNNEQKLLEANKKKIRNYETLSSFVKTLKPEFTFPFAAGAIYGGPRALLFPYYGVGTCKEAQDFINLTANSRSLLLSQHCSYDFETGQQIGEYREIDYQDQIEYIKDIAKKTSIFDKDGQFWVAESERIDLSNLLMKARKRQIIWQKRRGYASSKVFYLDVGDSMLYKFNLSDDLVTRVQMSKIDDGEYEIFRLPYSLLVGLLTGHYNWSNVKTQYISFYRKPDLFDPDLHILMSYLQL
jgi:hypothetical protein